MKPLHESLLDDEDVLISGVKDHNPFELMYLLHKQYKSWKKVPKKRINDIINSLPKANHPFYYGLAPGVTKTYKNGDYLSTNDKSFNHGAVGQQIKEIFKDKCKYEY